MEMYEESRADALEAVKVSNGECVLLKRQYHGTATSLQRFLQIPVCNKHWILLLFIKKGKASKQSID